MPLSVEAVLDAVRPTIPKLHVRKKVESSSPLPKVKEGSDTSVETTTKLSLISGRALKIAGIVREKCEKPHSTMWAQGYAVLSDGRIATLQQQQNELGESETLEIDISPFPDSQYRVHIRYDLPGNFINTYEVGEAYSRPVTAYWIHDRPNGGTRIPADLMLYEIAGPVDEILKMVEVASENIVRKESELTPRTSGVLQAGQVITLQ